MAVHYSMGGGEREGIEKRGLVLFNIALAQEENMIGYLLGFIAVTGAFAIPILAITLSHKGKTQKGKIRELELQKEILELELKKQNGNIKLLEEENKKYDRIINGAP